MPPPLLRQKGGRGGAVGGRPEACGRLRRRGLRPRLVTGGSCLGSAAAQWCPQTRRYAMHARLGCIVVRWRIRERVPTAKRGAIVPR